eukprot:gene22567-29694_t
MASPCSDPSPTSTPAAWESGDIKLRFGDNQKPLRAHSQLLKLASPTVLGPMLDTGKPKTSYLVYNFSAPLKHAARQVESEEDWAQGKKKMKHTVGEWLWLLQELQLVDILSAFHKLKSRQSKGRLGGIRREVTAAATPRQQVAAVEMVMAEFEADGMEDVLR